MSRYFLYVLAASLAACDASDPTGVEPVASVEIRPLIVRLLPGDTLRLEAVPQDADGRPVDRVPLWSTAGAAVATVSQAGLVTAVSPGWGIAIASSEGEADTVFVAVGIPFESVAAGEAHSCGLTAEGAAWCWGSNAYGQLGDGSGEQSEVPTPVAGGHRFEQLSAADYLTCGIRTDGRVLCWGYHGRGALGTGLAPETCRGAPCSRVPVEPVGGMTFRSVAVGGLFGGGHTCAATTGGAVYCWGDNREEQAGFDGPGDCLSVSCAMTPAEVTGLAGVDVRSVVAGAEHTCALDAGGTAYCWGNNRTSALGRVGDVTAPAAVNTLVRFAGLAAGSQHTCGLTADGAAWCWGVNDTGQLGFSAGGEPCDRFSGGAGDAQCVSVPTRVQGEYRFAALAAGWQHTCGATLEGAALCWGGGDEGALGTGDLGSTAQPTPLWGDLRLRAVAATFSHTCGVSEAGAALCWGAPFRGLGTGIPGLRRSVPVHVAPPGPLPEGLRPAMIQ